MSGALDPLPLSVRMSDADYPGVIRSFGNGWRLVVSTDGRRYRLQPFAAEQGIWFCPPRLVAASLAELCAKGASEVEGLAQACEGLPDDPALAVPGLADRRAAQLAALAANRSVRAVLRAPNFVEGTVVRVGGAVASLRRAAFLGEVRC